MNKLLPILLAVVLTGCGGEVKSPLENCANVALNLNFELTEKEIDSIELSQDEYEKKWNTSFSDIMWRIYKNEAERKVRIQPLQDLTLKGKLENKIYERNFKKCERERRRYPETFDAKWK